MDIRSLDAKTTAPTKANAGPAPQEAPAPTWQPDMYKPLARVKTGGVHTDWTAHLPGPLRWVVVQAEARTSMFGNWVAGLFHRGAEPKPADATDPAARATAALQAMARREQVPGRPGTYFKGPDRGLAIADVWPQGQVIAATLDQARLTGDYKPVDKAMAALSLYLHKGAYVPGVPGLNSSTKLYDDNAWVGLNFMQAYQQTGNADYLAHAKDLFKFIQKGVSPQGGLFWEEHDQSRNTCSNGPAIEYALRLYQATGDKQYLAFAQKLDTFMNGQLRSKEGLYYDSIGGDGKVQPTIWTYNQGVALGSDVLWYKITGDKKYLDRARQTAKAALDYFGKDDRLWSQPPVFNAIFFRNLMALDAVAPDPAYRKTMDDYLNRVWTQARDPKTGLFSQGGIGNYDGPGSTIDQAGLAQLFALQAWKKGDIGAVS